MAFKSFTEHYLDGTGIFKDAILAILGALANQERVRLSERVTAGLERARKQAVLAGGRGGNTNAIKMLKRFASCARTARASETLPTS